METTTNELAVWAYSNTGTLAHAFLRRTADGRLQAACRRSITRNADATVYQSEDISGRLCTNCDTQWNAHLARVERSMQPLQPCESVEVYGAAPETVDRTPAVQPEPATDTQNPGRYVVAIGSNADYWPTFNDHELAVAHAASYGLTASAVRDRASRDEPTTPTHLQRPACKTVIKADTTWTLESRKDNTAAWSYVSDHGSEEAATFRAQAFLIEGSRRQFRVVEHRTEARATDPIEAPKDTKPQPNGPRYVVEPVRLGFAVMDTSTGKPEARMGSRYAANDMADRLNAESAQ
ncbi:hypothetical protein [Kitasatospora purpeofusca]|uniref:hypothetical protein n=1 Tax=Kitasatospora purpeofusca TaxID=67352 RepID=UPI0036BA90BE